MQISWKRILKRWGLALLLPLGLLLTLLSKLFSAFFERFYARGIYHWLSQGVGWFFSLFPFSVGEFLLYAAVLLFLFFAVQFAVWLCRHREGRGQRIADYFRRALCVLSVVYMLYVLNCGLNYNRAEFLEYSGISVTGATRQELGDLCEQLAYAVNQYRAEAGQEDVPSISQMGEETQVAMQKLSAEYEVLAGWYGRPKPVLASRALSALNITGMFFPFTFEANVNVDVPAQTIPSTMCHELTHLRGFMREDEANFIAYLACMKSESPFIRYSGTLLAFTYSMNELYRVDSQRHSEISSLLTDVVRMDLNAQNEYWKQFEGKVAQVSSSVNDYYLKVNNQQDGVQSYNRMVNLLLGYVRQHAGELPQ